MFTGEYYHSIDDKSRIKFPKALLKALQPRGNSGLMLCKGYNNPPCLCILTTKDWLGFVRTVQDSVPADADKQAINRFLSSGAMPCSIDELGRLLIPQSLKEYANLKKEVVIVGVFDRVEIWDKDMWSHYCNLEFDTIGETIGKVDRPKLPEFRLIRGTENK